ncbi:MAG: phage head closure protein [Parvibaculum sp.]|nr:phage head closure protein [Parvibaculum sp.]
MSMVGQLRERVVIEKPTRVGDGTGGESLSWAVLGTVWAEVRSRTGTEVTLGERDEARSRFTVTMRHRDDVSADMRLVWRAQVLNIRSLRDPDGHRRWLAIDAEGGVA